MVQLKVQQILRHIFLSSPQRTLDLLQFVRVVLAIIFTSMMLPTFALSTLAHRLSKRPRRGVDTSHCCIIDGVVNFLERCHDSYIVWNSETVSRLRILSWQRRRRQVSEILVEDLAVPKDLANELMDFLPECSRNVKHRTPYTGTYYTSL